MIKILCVGRLKEKWLLQASAEYLTRLSKYCRLEVAEIKEHSDRNPRVSKSKEAAELIGRIGDKSKYQTIALDVSGKQMTSEEFSNLLKNQNLLFIVGGPEGLDEKILSKSDLTLSLSKMTFTHQIARILLLEQIYRGFTIQKNEKYHR